MGAQECPFQDPNDKKYYGYEYGSTDVLIENLNTGKKIQFNTLLPHMIRYHHFFESPNVSHRLDPKDVIEIFNLQEGIDYSPKYVTKYYWSIDMSSSHLEDYIKELKNNIIEQSATRICLNKYETDKIIVYLIPFNISMYRDNYDNMDSMTYENIRHKMFQLNNERSMEFNMKYSDIYSKIYRISEINQIIDKEKELIELYRKNKQLFHPEYKDVKMHILIIRKMRHLDNEDFNFNFEGIEIEFPNYYAYAFGSLSQYKYIHINENL